MDNLSSNNQKRSFVAAISKDPNKMMKVVVVGGTHGNEYTGVWCVKALDRQLQKDPAKYSSKNLDLSTIIGNPKAYMNNRRFIDEDLNRQFSYERLMTKKESSSELSQETKRARELDQLLGPKFSDSGVKPKTDVIIDLHTTTSNMKTTLIVGAGDPLMAQAAAYVKSKCPNVEILLHTHKSQEERPHLSSIAPHSFSIEVGPVPQGVIRHDVVDQTQNALEAVLEFLTRHQMESSKVLVEELRQTFPNDEIPCIRSAPSTRPGEMSSKIKWPSDPENPNFPAWMVHPSVQDQDFQIINEGDPLFIDLDGNTINYDGSHGSEVILMFINEGGYYYATSGTGIAVAKRDYFSLSTGELIPSTKKEDSNGEL